MGSKNWKVGPYGSEYLVLSAFQASICWAGNKEKQGYQGSFNGWHSPFFQSMEAAKVATELEVCRQLSSALSKLHEGATAPKEN